MGIGVATGFGVEHRQVHAELGLPGILDHAGQELVVGPEPLHRLDRLLEAAGCDEQLDQSR
jgi:hypothetical protein